MANPMTTTSAPAPAAVDLGTVLVTGAASGLGAAIARRIAERGGLPLALDRAIPSDEFEHHVIADLTDPRAAEAAIREAAERAGGIDAIVCAAGTDACGPLESTDAADWERVIAVNLVGTAAVVRAALPSLLAAPQGRIVTVASTLGLKALPDATAYCASKFGVIGFSRALATELAGRVGVTTLIPGGMATSFFDGRADQYKPGPDADLAAPEQVADAVLFALERPAGLEVREMVVCPPTEPSWP